MAAPALPAPRTPALERATKTFDPALAGFRQVGDMLLFCIQALLAVPLVVTRYRKEYLRIIGEITFGARLLALAASTMFVAAGLSATVGVQLALEGYQSLAIIGLSPLAGYLSTFATTRELCPLLTAFGIAAQMGSRYTSELGAMRVTDEIDALEVMSVPSLAYLVTTRMLAAISVAIPLFLAALAGSWLATQVTISAISGQGSGTYQHYFHEFLTGSDVIKATAKVVIFAVLISAIHCYYGYNTTGGPEGVGKAAGRAIRASVVTIAVSDMLMTLLFWGTSSGIKIQS